MKNKMGFTLVELLTVIVILGIVVGISFPVISGIKDMYEKREISLYADSLTSSSKLYVSSYDNDLFGYSSSGCAYITYSMLKTRKLIKDIDVSDLSCDSNNTFVRVVKLNDNYVYTPYLACGKIDASTNTINSISNIFPEADTPHTMDVDSCNGVAGGSIVISAVPGKQERYVKYKELFVNLTSFTGVNRNVSLSYAWNNTNEYSDGLTWTPLSFKVPSSVKQEKAITNGEAVSVKSDLINTPLYESGSYYLFVRAYELSDLYGTDAIGDTEYVSFGPYNIDNQPPVISSFVIESVKPSYHSNKVRLLIDASDNVTSRENLSMSVSKNMTFSEYADFHTATPYTIASSLDGSTRQLNLSVVDEAGNEAVKESNPYHVYKECRSLKYIDGTTCNVTCGNGTYNRTAYDLHTNTRCPDDDSSSGGSACTMPACLPNTVTVKFDANGGKIGSSTYANVTINYNTSVGTKMPANPTRDGFTFVKWVYNSATFTNSTKVTANITVLAEWRANVLKIKYNAGGSYCASSSKFKCSGSSIVFKSTPYLVNGDSTILQVANYGTNVTIYGFKDSNAINLSRDFYILDTGNEWQLNSSGTYLKAGQAYSAVSLCSSLKTGDCTITLNPRWRKTRVRYVYYANGGVIIQYNGTPTSNTVHYGGWEDYDTYRKLGVLNHNSNYLSGSNKSTIPMRKWINNGKKRCEGNFIWAVGSASSGTTVDERTAITNHTFLQNKAPTYYESLKHNDVSLPLYAKYSC